jgi:hypothetical protein
MWVVVHLYVGLAIGQALHLPFAVVALVCLASHVLLDLVPHWDYTRSRRMVLWGWVDFLSALATLVVCRTALGTSWAVLVMGPIAALPDVDVLAYAITGRRGRKWFPSHWDSFPHGRCGPLQGILVQLGVMAASAAVFLLAM